MLFIFKFYQVCSFGKFVTFEFYNLGSERVKSNGFLERHSMNCQNNPTLEFQSGAWWKAKVGNRTGLIPSNYGKFLLSVNKVMVQMPTHKVACGLIVLLIYSHFGAILHDGVTTICVNSLFCCLKNFALDQELLYIVATFPNFPLIALIIQSSLY